MKNLPGIIYLWCVAWSEANVPSKTLSTNYRDANNRNSKRQNVSSFSISLSFCLSFIPFLRSNLFHIAPAMARCIFTFKWINAWNIYIQQTNGLRMPNYRNMMPKWTFYETFLSFNRYNTLTEISTVSLFSIHLQFSSTIAISILRTFCLCFSNR